MYACTILGKRGKKVYIYTFYKYILFSLSFPGQYKHHQHHSLLFAPVCPGILQTELSSSFGIVQTKIPFPSSFFTWYTLRTFKVYAQCPKLWFKVITAELEQGSVGDYFCLSLFCQRLVWKLKHNRHSINRRMNKWINDYMCIRHGALSCLLILWCVCSCVQRGE